MKLSFKYHQELYSLTQALTTLFVYPEFTKKKVFEQLTAAVVVSGHYHLGSQNESISECEWTDSIRGSFYNYEVNIVFQ